MLQIAIFCTSARRMTRFWAIALGYEAEPPPEHFDNWNDYWRSIGVRDDELDQEGDGSDLLRDPAGHGPRIWFQEVSDPKAMKNRLHFDLSVSGGRDVPLETRKARVDAEVDRLVAAGAIRAGEVPTEGIDHYAVAMRDPEGNEFDVN